MMRLRPTALTTIEIIDKYLSIEEEEALTIRVGKNNDIVITPKQHLTALYGHLYSLHDPDTAGIYVAEILESNRLNFKKIKQLAEHREELLKLDSYYQIIDKENGRKKTTGIITSSDAGADNLSLMHLKTRTGSSQYAREYDLEAEWDYQNEVLLNSVRNLSLRNQNASNWKFSENNDLIREAISVGSKEADETSTLAQITRPIFKPANPDEDNTIYLNTIDLNSQQTASTTRTNSYSNSGRSVKSDTKEDSKISQYTKAKAITDLQLKQEINIRERIYSQFSSLFTERQCR